MRSEQLLRSSNRKDVRSRSGPALRREREVDQELRRRSDRFPARAFRRQGRQHLGDRRQRQPSRSGTRGGGRSSGGGRRWRPCGPGGGGARGSGAGGAGGAGAAAVPGAARGPVGAAAGATKGHQVFKFDKNGNLLMTLGKPGGAADPDFFYQPNDVLVAPNGDIFVSEIHGAGGGVIL